MVESLGTRFDTEMARLAGSLGGMVAEVANLKKRVSKIPSSSSSSAGDT